MMFWLPCAGTWGSIWPVRIPPSGLTAADAIADGRTRSRCRRGNPAAANRAIARPGPGRRPPQPQKPGPRKDRSPAPSHPGVTKCATGPEKFRRFLRRFQVTSGRRPEAPRGVLLTQTSRCSSCHTDAGGRIDAGRLSTGRTLRRRIQCGQCVQHFFNAPASSRSWYLSKSKARCRSGSI
jgi:hypothetical protein